MHQFVQPHELQGMLHGTWQTFPTVLSGRDRLVQDVFDASGAWGMESAIDLFACDAVAIRDEGTLRAFALALTEHLAMRRYGEPHLAHFGQQERVAGFSLSQFIETSEIAGHFINQANAACLNIFSCKSYAPYQAAAFCQQWFSAQAVELHILFRGPQSRPATREGGAGE